MSLSLVTSIETMVPRSYMYLGYFCGSSAMYMYIPHLLLLTLNMICIYIYKYTLSVHKKFACTQTSGESKNFHIKVGWGIGWVCKLTAIRVGLCQWFPKFINQIVCCLHTCMYICTFTVSRTSTISLIQIF